DMIMQRKIEILPNENVGDIHDKLMHLGAQMVVETVNAIIDGTLTTTPQPEGEFTPAPKIFKEDCRIEWSKSATDVHNHVRGLSPYPAAWTVIVEDSGRPLECKVFTTKLTDKNVGDNPIGKITIDGKRLLVAASDKWLEIIELQPAGKKRLAAESFLLGYHPSHIQL
ncbi:MAG: methionyl-tRNA formyltransferase, partial [Muribaculaceae bacterium]|nr:methionyl-tRNA formyltransferase [Muribaculaceae bacterium]